MATQNRLKTSQSEGGLSGVSQMSDARRQKLINLKKREDLKGALAEKFKGRFGHGARERAADEMSVASSHIRREVDKFAENAAVTENNLYRLERRLQQKAVQGSGAYPADDARSVSGVSNYSMGSRRSRSVASLTGDAVMKTSMKNPEGFDWARLDEYASFLHEQDAIRQKMGVSALQKKLRMDLDAQVNDKAAKKAQADEEEQRYHANSMVELERWKQMEQLRSEEMHNKLMREKKDRDDQLAFEQSLKDEEENKRKNEETTLVDKIVNEMESEQRRFEKKKTKTKAAMRKVFEENMEDTRKRNDALRAQKENEAEAMKEYNRVLDEQEEQRATELADRMARQKELMDRLMANVSAQQKDAGDNDAMRANAQQEEMDRHFFEAESKKQSRLKQLRLENQAYLLRQMGEKDMRKDDDSELTNIQAQILKKDTEEYNSIEAQKAIDKRYRNFEHRKEIERQMDARANVRVAEMSEAEIQMNKPLLHLVHRTLNTRDQNFEDEPQGEEEDY